MPLVSRTAKEILKGALLSFNIIITQFLSISQGLKKWNLTILLMEYTLGNKN